MMGLAQEARNTAMEQKASQRSNRADEALLEQTKQQFTTQIRNAAAAGRTNTEIKTQDLSLNDELADWLREEKFMYVCQVLDTPPDGADGTAGPRRLEPPTSKFTYWHISW